MISPNPWDKFTAAEWRITHARLREALAQEIADAEPLGERLHGPAWFVEVSHKSCGICGCRMLRVRIKGHPDSPFYACGPCSLLGPYTSLVRVEAPMRQLRK